MGVEKEKWEQGGSERWLQVPNRVPRRKAPTGVVG